MDSKNNIWISGEGLCKFDGEGFEHYTSQNSDIPVDLVQSIAIDSKDNIWFNTSAGYAVYDGDKWAVDDTNFRDSGVFAIEQSPDGRIWIGTGDGIYIND